ncbi:transmembrane and immunoglobulin domain-containing protein 1-like [Panulirus ornatus]|uniref:transmembrane and immunoglobulin domain-containing protein 1-like n=1 Tax=Panulirus ornatus TaxID=150431 RepID=UPI003A8C6860
MIVLRSFLHVCAVFILSAGKPQVRAESDTVEWASDGSGVRVGGGDQEARAVDEQEEESWAAALTLNTQGPLDPNAQNNTEVLAQVGGQASFSCSTHHLSDEMVTWMKRDDDELLTVGQQVYSAENRFTATHSHATKAWVLMVKDVQLSDAGHYECQLTTHPPVTFFYTLKVTQAEAVVSGPSEVHIEEGSKLALECHVRHAVEPPIYIFWFHNSTMVNYGPQQVVRHQNFTSSLVVTRVQLSDAGTYSCQPHLATPANVTVHVVTGKTPAAMQHGRNQVEGGGGAMCRPSFAHILLSAYLTCLLAPLLAGRPPPSPHHTLQ